MPVEPAVELQPITAADVQPVTQFLRDELNVRSSAATWASGLIPTWVVEQPNYGFLLRCRGKVVGAYMAFYSEREIDGAPQRFCNLASWAVAEPHRSQGLRLLRALLRQKGYHFTDLTPTGNVPALNARLGFATLDTSTVVVPNLPWPVRSRGVRAVSDRREIEKVLRGRDLSIYLDHARAAAAHHVVLVRGAETCYVIFRRASASRSRRHGRRRGVAGIRRGTFRLPLFAVVLYVSNKELFRVTAPCFFRHLLLRHGILATLVESHVAGERPAPSVTVSPRPKMYRSDTLRQDQVDYLYSELTCLQW